MKKWLALILVVCLTTALFPLAQAEGEWTCSSCGKENARNFCTSCGAAKPMEEWVCPDCGNANRADDHFCVNCGKKKGGTYADLVGKYVTFGQFSMYADGTYDDIEWLVLDVDGSKALLLSRYGLIAMRYHDRDEDVTWATSTIRIWLNQYFYNVAFPKEAQAAILTMQVDNSASQHHDFSLCLSERDFGHIEPLQGGEDTQDRIFLLSFAEGEKYLSLAHGCTKKDLIIEKPQATVTLYAKESGVYLHPAYTTVDDEPVCCWWLRSPGITPKTAACVSFGGFLGFDQSAYSGGAVRPAMWVDLEQLTIGEGNQLMYPGMPTKRPSATNSPSPKPTAKATAKPTAKATAKPTAKATAQPTPQTDEGVVIGDAFRFLATADKGDEYVFLDAGEGYTLVFDFSHSENEADTYVLHVLDLIESGMDPKELKEIGSPADVLAVLAEASFGKKAKINTTGNFVWCYVSNNDDGQSYGTLLALQDNALLMCETYGVASVEAAGDYMAAMLPMMTRITN